MEMETLNSLRFGSRMEVEIMLRRIFVFTYSSNELFDLNSQIE